VTTITTKGDIADDQDSDRDEDAFNGEKGRGK
jgi:hypothetical protein